MKKIMVKECYATIVGGACLLSLVAILAAAVVVWAITGIWTL